MELIQFFSPSPHAYFITVRYPLSPVPTLVSGYSCFCLSLAIIISSSCQGFSTAGLGGGYPEGWMDYNSMLQLVKKNTYNQKSEISQAQLLNPASYIVLESDIYCNQGERTVNINYHGKGYTPLIWAEWFVLRRKGYISSHSYSLCKSSVVYSWIRVYVNNTRRKQLSE